MKLLRHIIRKFTKEKKVHRDGFIVPACDYNLLRFIRVMHAAGDSVTIHPLLSDVSDEDTHKDWQHANAEILNQYYGYNQFEVAAITGFWVEDKAL